MIDFGRVSLDTLLKMARDAELISHYERRERYALIVVHEARHLVTHETARSFLQEILIDWWNQQLAQDHSVMPTRYQGRQTPDPLL